MNYSHIVLNTNDSWSVEEANFTLENVTFETQYDNSTIPYYGQYLRQFRNGYLVIHGYISLVVCIFGFFANILNIIILTRKNMVSPINAILTGLAVTDMLALLFYIPYCINKHFLETYSFSAAAYHVFFPSASSVIHNISVWLTVTVAIWRYIGIKFPLSSKNFLSMHRAKIAIACVCVSSALYCIPIYMLFDVSEYQSEGRLMYYMNYSDFAQKNKVLEQIVFWMFSVVIKLIPCIILTGLSAGLISVIHKASHERHKLTNHADSKSKTHDRTTKMLLVVLVMFLVTEFPSGILGLLRGIFGRDFFKYVYQNFVEILDILVLINGAINFIIYYSMSQYFRKTFLDLFLVRIFKKEKHLPAAESSRTTETTNI